MNVKWYGHAAFKLTTAKGVRIILDPYEPGFGGALTYGAITDEADLVLTSHDHGDHSYVREIKGKFTRIEKEGSYDERKRALMMRPGSRYRPYPVSTIHQKVGNGVRI